MASIRGARIVTFGNGMVVTEPIVDLDDPARCLVCAAVSGTFTHYYASVHEGETGSRIVWIADLLPNEAAGSMGAMIEEGAAVMPATLDRLADEAGLVRVGGDDLAAHFAYPQPAAQPQGRVGVACSSCVKRNTSGAAQSRLLVARKSRLI